MIQFPINMQILKLTSMALGILLAWYFAGPLIAELARSGFEIFYSWRYGYIPSIWSLEYYFTFMPMRGHVTYYAYLYANKIATLIAAPLFYKLPDMIVACFRNDPEKVNYVISQSRNDMAYEQADDFLDTYSPSFIISHDIKPSKNRRTTEESPCHTYHYRNLKVIK